MGTRVSGFEVRLVRPMELGGLSSGVAVPLVAVSSTPLLTL
jgi:hypothetical protein